MDGSFNCHTVDRDSTVLGLTQLLALIFLEGRTKWTLIRFMDDTKLGRTSQCPGHLNKNYSIFSF